MQCEVLFTIYTADINIVTSAIYITILVIDITKCKSSITNTTSCYLYKKPGFVDCSVGESIRRSKSIERPGLPNMSAITSARNTATNIQDNA